MKHRRKISSKVNYSSARQGLLEDRKEYKKYQNYMIEHFLDEVYEEFVTMLVMEQMIDVDLIDFLENKEKYLEHQMDSYRLGLDRSSKRS